MSAIREKRHIGASKQIKIQPADNAKPRMTDDDSKFRLAAIEDGFNMKLVQQPPNSLTTNVLDSGYS